jgi:hypothetical protein
MVGFKAVCPFAGHEAPTEAPLDLKKLTPGEMTIAISGVVLLIFSFFKWYGCSGRVCDIASSLGAKTSWNGWQAPDAFFSVIAIIIGVVMAAHVIVNKLAGVEMPERLGSVGWGVFYLGGGVIAFVFLLIKWLGNTDGTKFGLYISVLAGLGLAVGGFLTARERGDLAALQNRGAGGTGGTGGGSTPPAA